VTASGNEARAEDRLFGTDRFHAELKLKWNERNILLTLTAEH